MEDPEDDPDSQEDANLLEPDSWRPVWEEDETEAEAAVPPWLTPSRTRRLTRREPDWRALIPLLAAAEDALSRLDAGAAAASEPVRAGLIARLAFAEAAGWLTSAAGRAWVHPRDLALAEAGLLGDFAAAALSGRAATTLPSTASSLGGGDRAARILAEDADRLPDGATLAQGLALARALRRLVTAQSWDPLTSPAAAAAALTPLGPEGSGLAALRVRRARFTAWRRTALAGAGPPLLAAAMAAATWLEAEALEESAPTPAQALLLAAAVARRLERVRAIPLPFWGGGPGVQPLGLPLRDAAAWPGAFLGRVAVAARHGLAELHRLRDAEAAAAQLSTKGRQSLLPAAADAALRMPALTARGLARQLRITPQGALLLLKRLQAAGVVREATGRRSFRAYVV
ncbi:MAG: hypothetical protein IRZ07_23800 [Microbispora sp.]|nr:hypothetical protein [Microbispora sp.]